MGDNANWAVKGIINLTMVSKITILCIVVATLPLVQIVTVMGSKVIFAAVKTSVIIATLLCKVIVVD
jgi:hypothetical protein